MAITDDWLKWIDEEIKHLDEENMSYGKGVRLRRGPPGQEEDVTDSAVERNAKQLERLRLLRETYTQEQR